MGIFNKNKSRIKDLAFLHNNLADKMVKLESENNRLKLALFNYYKENTKPKFAESDFVYYITIKFGILGYEKKGRITSIEVGFDENNNLTYIYYVFVNGIAYPVYEKNISKTSFKEI